MTITITVNGTPYSVDATPTQVTGLADNWKLSDPSTEYLDYTSWFQHVIQDWATTYPAGITRSGPIDTSTGLPTTITIGIPQMMAQCLASWDAAGPSPAPTPPTPVPLTGTALIQALIAEAATAAQNLIDATAQARQYKDGVTCASYVNSTIVSWAADASAFIKWRDSVWSKAITVEDQLVSGIIQTPSLLDFIAQMPVIVWPS